jgi:5-methylcytosine-specific restriction endonuclease McrA
MMTGRQRSLYYLGFKTYRAYLKSPLWRSIRKRVFALKGRTCSLCPCRANQVHHRRYDRATLSGALLTFLEPICDKCHTEIERTPTGRKRHPAAVDRLFLKRRKLAR